MNKLCFLTISILWPCLFWGQDTDSLQRAIRAYAIEPADKISYARAYLQTAFTDGDMGDVNAWLGFLQTELDDNGNAATLSDERWLLYFWTANYSLLFSEVADFEDNYENRYQYQDPPQADNLFSIVDQYSFNHRHELYNGLQGVFLSEEEKAFATLLLDYLLRVDADAQKKAEQNSKIEVFVQKYPNSRFKKYALDYMHSRHREKGGKGHFMGGLLLQQSRADGALGINFKPNLGIQGSIGYCLGRMNFIFQGKFGGQRVRREFDEGSDFYVIPDSIATTPEIGLEFGCSLLNTTRLHVMPTIGGGFSFISYPINADFTDDYTNLTHSSPFWSASVNVDWKIIRLSAAAAAKGPWTSLRFRLGYQHLSFGKDNIELRGSQVFIGVGLAYHN